MKKYGKALVNLLIAVVILMLVIFLLPRLLAFFAPFLVGLVIAWMAGPIVGFFEKKFKLKRRAGSAFVIIAVIALIVLFFYGVGSILVREGMGFAASVPELVKSVQEDLAEAGEHLNRIYRTLPENMQNWLGSATEQVRTYAGEAIGRMGTPTIAAVGNFAKYLPTVFIAVIMALLSAYFFVADREHINEWCRRHVPRSLQEQYGLVKDSMLRAVGGYIKAQFKIEIWIYLLLVIGLWILQVKYVLLIALGIAFLDFLPFFGAGAVMIPWAVFKILGGDYKMAVGLLIIWGVGQLARQIIQPKIVGDSIGLSPLPTLFLLYLGYRFGGVLGMIIAIPVGLILFSMYEGHVFDTTLNSLKLLIYGLNHFRRLDREDLSALQGEENKGKK